jgi:hypothetical protein
MLPIWTSCLEWLRAHARWLLGALCLFLLATSLAAIASVLRFPSSGWDFHSYCRAQAALAAGRDPVGVGLFPFVYPPLAARLLGPLCAAGTAAYPWVYAGALLASYAITRRRDALERVFLATLLVGGFDGAYWSFATGNVGLIELLLLAAAFAAGARGRWWPFGLVIAWLGFLKLLPLLYLLPLLLRPGAASLRMRLRPVAMAGLGFVALHLVSWALYPAYTHSYVSLLLHPPYPFVPDFGWANPAPVLLLLHAMGALGMPTPVALLALAAGVALTALAFRRFCLAHAGDPLPAVAFGLLCVLMWLPRLKPYTLAHAVVPVFWLARDRSVARRAALVLASVALPAALRVHIPMIAAAQGRLWLEGGQAFALLLCAGLLFAWGLSDRERDALKGT